MLIKIFPTTPKAHSNSSDIFSYPLILLIFSEEIIQNSRTFAPQDQTSWNQANAPRPSQELSNETKNAIYQASWFARSHKHKTKQTNYLAS